MSATASGALATETMDFGGRVQAMIQDRLDEMVAIADPDSDMFIPVAKERKARFDDLQVDIQGLRMAKMEWQASLGLNVATEPPFVSPRSASSSGVGMKLPKDLPCFRSPNKSRENNVEDASEFLQLLEAELEFEEIPPGKWTWVLAKCCGNPKTKQWVLGEIVGKRLDWDSAKKEFRRYFGHALEQKELKDRLKKLHQDDMTASDYATEYTTLVRRLGMDEGDSEVVDKFVDGLRIDLQASLRGFHHLVPKQRSLSEMVEVARVLEETLKPPEGNNKTEKKKVKCYDCGEPGHKKGDARCQGAKDKKGEKPKSSGGSKNGASKEVVCYRCNEKGHKAPDCKVKVVRMVQVADSEEGVSDTEAGMAALVGAVHRASVDSVGEKMSTRGLVTPCLVNGVPVKARVDSCAEVSVLSADLAMKIGVEVVTAPGKIQGAFSGAPVMARRQTATPVEIKNGTLTLSKVLEVQALNAGVEMLLGYDLFGPLGYSIVGVPVRAPENEMEKREDDEDTVDCDFDGGMEEKDWPDEWKEAIAANADLDPFTPCNLPGSTIELDTGDAKPVYRRPYRIPEAHIHKVDARVKEWQDKGLVVPAPVGNPWNSPLVVVPKKDEFGKKTGIRVCLDLRGVNKILKDEKFPVPVILDLLDKLQGARFVTKLDQADSFHLLGVKKDHQPKLGFIYKGKSYMWTRAPFGLKTLTAVFQRLMQTLFCDLDCVIVYVDDIVVVSQTWESHVQDVTVVIDRLTAANLRLRQSKCVFAARQAVILGHLVDGNGLHMEPEKVALVANWPQPKTVKELQSFLGFVNFYRHFIRGLADLTAPLDAHRTKKHLVWDDTMERAFCSIKEAIMHR